MSSKSIEGKETEIYLEYRRRAADGNPLTGVLALHSSAEREREREKERGRGREREKKSGEDRVSHIASVEVYE